MSTSIRFRFVSTLIANVFKFIFGFFSGMFIARALGPSDFGDFNFLLTSFVSIMSLLDLGASNAFYTFISRQKKQASFYFYYTGWLVLQFMISFLLSTVLLPESMMAKIWLGHQRWIVVLALLASFSMNQIWQAITQIGESVRATVTVQIYNIALSAAYMFAILLMIRLNVINIVNLFMLISAEHLIVSFLLLRRLRGQFVNIELKESVGFSKMFNDFKEYCSPLVITSLISFLYGFVDNWMLQRFGGATEQGYYSVGYRFTFLSSIATASMLQVFWKEIAETWQKHGKERTRLLVYKVTRILYLTSAIISCFLVPFAKELILWILGPSYEGALPSLAIMLFFPIVATLGQVWSTVLLASGQTRIYRNYAIIFMLIGIPATFFMIAPPNAVMGMGGLGLASKGMAIKMVAYPFIGINILIYILSKLWSWRFDFWYQIYCIAILLPLSWVSKELTVFLLGSLLKTVSAPTLLTCALFIYAVSVSAVIYAFPSLTGLGKDEIKSLLEKIRARLTPESP